MNFSAMDVLLCGSMLNINEYVKLLANAYQKNGHRVIFGAQNFLYSDYVPDFVHIQWPEAIYRWESKLPASKETLGLLRDRLDFYLSNNIPIVYTVHNRLPHENVQEFDKEIYRIISNAADVFVHHGEASISLVMNDFPESKKAQHIVCPHGPYPYVALDSKKSREAYNLSQSKYVFLNFGLQRKYKGYVFINTVFLNWSRRETCLFTIGPKKIKFDDARFVVKSFQKLGVEFEKNYASIKSSIAKSHKTFLRPVENSEIPQIMAASDVLFLGHQSGLNSGILALAATYGKPVVFPDLGNFRDQLEEWPWKEVYQAGDVNSATDALERIYLRISKHKPGDVVFDNNEWLTINCWDRHVKFIVEAVKKVER